MHAAFSIVAFLFVPGFLLSLKQNFAAIFVFLLYNETVRTEGSKIEMVNGFLFE